MGDLQQSFLKVLFVDATNGFYKVKRYKIGDYFGPVDLGIHISDNYDALNIGTGLFAGSIFPGSNRLIFSGFSKCWRGFYVSSMGGAGLVFDNLGINMVSIVGKAPVPSVLYLNRIHGEEIEVEVHPVEIKTIWDSGRKGVYSLTDYIFEKFGNRYENDPRILATGPASLSTDFGGILSLPIINKKITNIDTWAGRGGLGSKMVQDHNIYGIIYGGTFIDEDFRDRKVADEWFENKYKQKLAAKDFEATTKYRFDPKFGTGGTFGVNYTTMKGKIIAFNYKTIYNTEEERLSLHQQFIVNHYLKQFNEETIEKKLQANCGEPCSAVCKKYRDEYKKDYEPYQTMGPLCGIFDQRAAEKLNHYADSMGFDAISIGGVLSWFMELLDENLLSKEDLGVTRLPKFNPENFDVVKDSMNNAELGIELIDSILNKRGIINFSEGVRKWARRVHREKGIKIIDKFVYNAFGRKGWIVPNQYWTPGALAPMAIMGKYYMYYGFDFVEPRKLGKICADRMKQELILDNAGICRFHRAWAEEMVPEIFEAMYGMKDKFLKNISWTASRINSRNASVFWESERNFDFVYRFLKRIKEAEKVENEALDYWIKEFEKDKYEAGLNFWFEMLKGIDESLRDFQ
ncbi:MAG TPA: aldehyde ferredoxin oxidoreductase C-terminal domain-containing protein [Spirochaetota bacterium]|nr:aldehyde ferredoxin oxidoreductase C-terminal domain-containing protein [Spirochaetota bacterium]HOL56165.1 aldehyde ferredoxin oxidoreductase C-terminal domain-containing protein [Spirochaetota bacterium]HPP03614.1 aldehyde ferredoxin oxidoreductase C-terminal domain-containing protein [Spirochaetota bacterium]